MFFCEYLNFYEYFKLRSISLKSYVAKLIQNAATYILSDVLAFAVISTIIHYLPSVEYSELQIFLWNLLHLASTYK